MELDETVIKLYAASVRRTVIPTKTKKKNVAG